MWMSESDGWALAVLLIAGVITIFALPIALVAYVLYVLFT